VVVRRRGDDSSYRPSIRNVGVETGLYGKGPAALWRERNFGQLEEAWPSLRDRLISNGDLNGADRDQAGLFMALQIARTREHIAQTTFEVELAEFTEERPPSRETVRAFIRQRHRHDPDDAEVEGAWTLAAIALTQETVPSFDRLSGSRWT
jgi:hypothetical protein